MLLVMRLGRATTQTKLCNSQGCFRVCPTHKYPVQFRLWTFALPLQGIRIREMVTWLGEAIGACICSVPSCLWVHCMPAVMQLRQQGSQQAYLKTVWGTVQIPCQDGADAALQHTNLLHGRYSSPGKMGMIRLHSGQCWAPSLPRAAAVSKHLAPTADCMQVQVNALT